MRRFTRLSALLFLLLTALQGFTQTQGVLGKGFFDNWSVGIGGGPNIFFGDLKVHQFWPASSNMNEWKFGGTFTLTKQLSHVFAIRGQVLYSEISGTKRNYKDGTPCNEYFDGNILEGNLQGTVNFSNLFSGRYKPQRKFFVFGSLGLGASSWITNVKQLYTGIPLRKSDPRGNWTTVVMGMAGIGAYYSIHEKVNLGLDWSLHAVNSDFLDNTEGGFKYDAYSMLALTVTYNFNKYNPGKEPDTNANKIYVPVYIQAPPVQETKPEPKPEPAPVVITPAKDTVTEVIEYVSEEDSEDIFADRQDTGLVFRVQLFAFRSDKYTAAEVESKFRVGQEVYKDFSDGWYRFTVGSFRAYDDARKTRNEMRNKGFRGAFITRYKDGVRMSQPGKK